MKTCQAKSSALEYKHVRINGESYVSTECVGISTCMMVTTFTTARKARRVQIMRGDVDMQMVRG